MKNFIIRKASGKVEQFNPEKLKVSLLHSGAATEVIEDIMLHLKDWMYDGISTQEIYKIVFKLLKTQSKSNAMSYRLKKGLLELGETGFPFEHLVGEIFKRQGYSVEVGVVVEGRCVTHEMDVIATKEREQKLVECKYSGDQGKHVGVQVPLYVRSRVDDIIVKRKEMHKFSGLEFSGYVVTNTRFSEDAIAYGECSNLHLLGWSYPPGNGLKDLISRERIYPITVLSYLTKKEKEILMDAGVVTCKQLYEQMGELKMFKDFTLRKMRNLREELECILN